MLDLRQIENVSTKITWTDGELVTINQPTFGMFKELATIDEDDVTAQGKFLVKVLNNNTSGRKFKESDITDLNLSQTQAILQAVVNIKDQADKNPN